MKTNPSHLIVLGRHEEVTGKSSACSHLFDVFRDVFDGSDLAQMPHHVVDACEATGLPSSGAVARIDLRV